jgi:hypothetical protein
MLLLKYIDLAKQYQTIRHNGHCSDDTDCITHCTTHGLSHSKCSQHSSDCDHDHTSDCSDCLNIILTLDEIDRKIQKITDKDTKRKADLYFANASEQIIEWSRHNLRVARQDTEKSHSFLIWVTLLHLRPGQKNIASRVPRISKYIRMHFGTTGISLLVGSFVPKDQVSVLLAASTTTTSLSAATFATQSYTVT